MEAQTQNARSCTRSTRSARRLARRAPLSTDHTGPTSLRGRSHAARARAHKVAKDGILERRLPVRSLDICQRPALRNSHSARRVSSDCAEGGRTARKVAFAICHVCQGAKGCAWRFGAHSASPALSNSTFCRLIRSEEPRCNGGVEAFSAPGASQGIVRLQQPREPHGLAFYVVAVRAGWAVRELMLKT